MRHRIWFVLAPISLTLLLGSMAILCLPASDPDTSAQTTTVDGKELRKLERRLKALQPKGYYILIDTAANRLYLKKDEQTVLDALCSTGSGRRLIAGTREWTFKTPRGEFRVTGKVRNPLWRKPDWAFIEDGEPVPVNDQDRFEAGVLGEYALAIGDGYFIHGSLYNRLLGKNVTHGCVRLGSEDLVYLSRIAQPGTPVFIY